MWVLYLMLLLSLNRAHMAHASFGCNAKQSQSKEIAESMVFGRRKILHDIGISVCSTTLVTSVATANPSSAAAIWPFEINKERRQLEVCIVALLRLLYWAQSLTKDMSATSSPTEENILNRRKQVYLEARLGAKALVTGKVGGGATYRVFTLSKLELKDCLDDLEYWYSKTIASSQFRSTATRNNANPTKNLNIDLIESLASIVEFDGLETTQDPSPRSSLMLTMYNDDKGKYVQRMLTERVIPITEELINYFGPEARHVSETYISKYYPNEYPSPIIPSTSDSS